MFQPFTNIDTFNPSNNLVGSNLFFYPLHFLGKEAEASDFKSIAQGGGARIWTQIICSRVLSFI